MLLEGIFGRMAFGVRRAGGSGLFRGEGLGDSPPPSWRRGEPGASYLVGAAEPPARRRLQHAAPGRRRRAAGIAAARTRVGWGGADTRGPRGASPPAARKARNGGPRPDSCSGEAAAAGNTKRLIQPRWGGREGGKRGGNRGKNRRGRKKKGRKKRKETCKIRAGSARSGRGARLPAPRRGPRQRPRDRPGLSQPVPLGLGSVCDSSPPPGVCFFILLDTGRG